MAREHRLNPLMESPEMEDLSCATGSPAKVRHLNKSPPRHLATCAELSGIRVRSYDCK